MFVQWCIKGIRGRFADRPDASGLDDDAADDIVLNARGIQCNWWRKVTHISPPEIQAKLTGANLDRHVHDYDNFKDDTPFISLTAGCVERDVAMRLNRVHQAKDVALRFGTNWGEHHGYLFYCWVVVGLKRAATIQSVAEEIRELNTYVSWSDYQLEGEVTAKIGVPANQIRAWERWDCDGDGRVSATPTWRRENQRFEPPTLVSNIRELL